MKLSLSLRTALTQTLTPQQIQYLKLLQLPLVQLEQQVRQEIEQNPMLEETITDDILRPDDNDFPETFAYDEPIPAPKDEYDYEEEFHEAPVVAGKIDDEGDPFEFYKLVWQENDDYAGKSHSSHGDEDDNESFQVKYHTSLLEDLIEQFRLQSRSEEDFIIGCQIIGNLDDVGYLRRDLQDIVYETNERISEINTERAQVISQPPVQILPDQVDNPAKAFAISSSMMAQYKRPVIDELDAADSEVTNELNFKASNLNKANFNVEHANVRILNDVDLDDAERVLLQIQNLEPPGIASRSIQECLLAQCRAFVKPNAAQKLARLIIEEAYDAFIMKHYTIILKQFEVTEDYLREALEVIRRLNPKPGGFDVGTEINTVIPDFLIERDEKDELTITVNDSRLPTIKLNKAYEKLKREAKFKHFNKETREWIRTKYEDAKFLIQAIRQRKNTMLKVMTAIAGLQKDFFFYGPSMLKPLIYKDVSESTGLDISTVCRIVNGKYVQTEFGTFELKFFFSESLPNEEGEEISTTVIKQIIKEIIENEQKLKPYSDDKICQELKKRGYNVARRTVAKYREHLKLPVARLRKEI